MDVQKLWDDLGLVNRFSRRKGTKFWLLDGPPYPNAEPHLGHVRGVTMKDMFIKIKAMQGCSVWVKPGFDTHGLPIENRVEKELGIRSKDEIEKMGVSEFMRRCKDFATSNIDMWMKFYRDMGVWFGWEEPYTTLQKDYMDSVWWSVSELWRKGLMKTGRKPFYWCPHCQTVLSGYEVTDEYRELDDLSVFVKFPTDKGFSILVWTTTPWTLPGNTALVVLGDADYAVVETGGEKLVLAEKLLPVLERLDVKHKVLKKMRGKELEGISYGPVVDCGAQKSLPDKARKVHLSLPIIKQKVAGKVAEKKKVKEETQVGHFTNLEEGTGIVHCAPGHGAEDFELGKEYGLEVLSPVDDQGRFTGEVEQFAGKHVRDANPAIIDYLKEKGFLLGAEKIRHRYPVCWRCKSPLIFRMTEQWVLDVSQIKDRLVAAARDVEWLPGFAEERMLSWLANATDWTLSRQRYWNIPLPIWKCPSGHIRVVSGAEELEKLAGRGIDDLHRDVVDGVEFPCAECGRKMARVTDVLDVWYDSGASSFAVLGYPRDGERFKAFWPTDHIDEGQDQIRGWFYTLLVLGVALFDRAPYEKVSMHGWMVDEKGEKMSKSKGNFVTAREALEDLGPDVLRFFVLWEAAPWDVVKFSPERAKKEIGRMLHIWRNLLSYLVKFSPESPGKGELAPEDGWILSKYNSMLEEYGRDIEDYNLHYAMRKIYGFVVDDLSRKYMKLAKGRVRNGETTPLWILRHLVHGLTRLIAPVSPIFAEGIYAKYAAKFSGEESVFLDSYPEPDRSLVDNKLEKLFDGAFGIVEAVLAYRDEKGIGLKYPLRALDVSGFDTAGVEGLIMALTNTKSLAGCKGDTVEAGKVRLTIDATQGEAEIQEGLMREAARRVRSLRGKKGLNQNDKIVVSVWGDAGLVGAVKKLEKDFAVRVGASEIKYTEAGETRQEWKVKGKLLGVGI